MLQTICVSQYVLQKGSYKTVYDIKQRGYKTATNACTPPSCRDTVPPRTGSWSSRVAWAVDIAAYSPNRPSADQLFIRDRMEHGHLLFC